MKRLWCQYVFHKQTVEELSEQEQKDVRTIRRILFSYSAPPKIHHPRPVHIVTDGTYFGERKEGNSWCTIAVRDPHESEDLVWNFVDTETTSGYRDLRDELESLGYTILSVTGDGFSGIKAAFFDIPYQMCHVHMERLVVHGTTQKPQTEAGQVLLALIRTLHDTNSHEFHVRFELYKKRYRDFLNEKSFYKESGRWDWTHRDLRQAVMRIERHKKYLFTYEHDHNIVKNTNSIEGHFSHIKQRVGAHRGVPKSQAQKIIHSLLLASTVSPSKKQLDQIL